MSHPFVERLIGTVRREHCDHVFFWNAMDLERKLSEFKAYFNEQRTHASLRGDTPAAVADGVASSQVDLDNFTWKRHCNGLFQLPSAA